ncbi:putative zinc metalloprotease [Aureobasidium pullulans]|nr:putative zinc metalloprotease [Aureobasidium pullulans]
MARSSRNPFGFGPYVVTFFTVVIYAGLLAALIVTHHVLPPAPSTPTPSSWPGVNITQAWHDLERLSSGFHPFNSRDNVAVRKWLLARVGNILDANKVEWKEAAEATKTALPVTVFDKDTSNITYTDPRGYTVYYESNNIMVYVRGAQDSQDEWWLNKTKYDGPGGVLVNAHFDSVSTGFGATDDGVGIISVLQLLSHFTKQENQPHRGILFLLNNGEEDGLYGAKAFTRHPLAQFPRTFLNLEGAGAGGRATLFRSTDTEVTRFYSKSPHPFGSVVSGDGFKRGLVKSGTDYSIFVDDLGMRGLDVAFVEPRARYHTNQDNARETSVESLWHMLSSALTTVQGLSSDTSDQFERPSGHEYGKHDKTSGSTGVWFDLFGRVFAVFQLHTLFAVSVTLLVAGPIFLILFDVILHKTDKWYLFARKGYLHSSDDDEPVKMYGWRGFFRFPLIFAVASAIVVALAYLITKVNPHIIYSSEYAVWSMMLTAWLSTAWFFFRLGDAVRPSALSRAYVLIWLYALSWLGLVAATIGEQRMRLGSGYFLIIYNASVFLALLISYLEFFALPKKSVYVEQVTYASGTALPSPARSGSLVSHNVVDHDDASRGRAPAANDNEDADERTSLLGSRQTFTRYGRETRRPDENDDAETSVHVPSTSQAYEGEQGWSGSLPSWAWLLQFLILAPINLILIGQLGLLMTSALHQTPADGSPVLVVYLLIAATSVLLLLPLTPFIHRMTYHIPTFLMFVFIGTLIYNLVAFPFSRASRLKVFFLQQIDLDHGNNTVALTGLSPYLESIVSQMPSAADSGYHCAGPDYAFWAFRAGLDSCSWSGPAPNVVPTAYKPHNPSMPYPNSTVSLALARRQAQAAKYATWLDFNITRPTTNTSTRNYTFDIRGSNTRACRLYFSTPFANLTVSNAGAKAEVMKPGRFPAREQRVYLYSRDWDAMWSVNVTFDHEIEKTYGKTEGKVVCVWSDANQVGNVPAFDEVKHFMPVWSAVTKNSDGLVEGYKHFSL